MPELEVKEYSNSSNSSSVFPTAYFGNLNYFRALFNYASIEIEAKEHFIKQTTRNRCEILTARGVQALSIPVIRSNGSKTIIDQVSISYDTDWRKDHWKAIESAYSSSPYFEHYGSEVRDLIYQNESNLLLYNQTILNRIINWLDIPVKISFTNEYSGSKVEIDSLPHPVEKYIQVFGEQNSFVDNLSILDAIFCLGPMARKIIFPEPQHSS